MEIIDFFADPIARELLKTLGTIICKSCLCKSSAKRLRSTINELLPIIQEIKDSGIKFSQFRQEQFDRLSETLRDGLELCKEVLSSAWWNVYKNFKLARKMKKLETKVASFLNGPMLAHVLADVLHMRFESAERFDRLEQILDQFGLLMMIFLQGMIMPYSVIKSTLHLQVPAEILQEA